MAFDDLNDFFNRLESLSVSIKCCKKPEHIANNAIQLACGHFICDNCLNLDDEKIFKCHLDKCNESTVNLDRNEKNNFNETMQPTGPSWIYTEKLTRYLILSAQYKHVKMKGKKGRMIIIFWVRILNLFFLLKKINRI